MPKPAKCHHCKWEYPENLLNSMFVNGAHTPPICGQCALELSNQTHGTNAKKFHGPIAEHMRQLAIRWRKRNPKRGPQHAGTIH